MPDFKDRRVIAAIGAGVAVAAGLAVAAIMMTSRHGREAAEAPPASQGGLVVQTGHDDDAKLDPARPLPCFVDGKLVGDLPLNACAKRNGIAAGALDVGLDRSGALAAGNGDSAPLTPLPPATADVSTTDAGRDPATDPTSDSASGGAVCWRRAGGAWRRLPTEMSLDACVQTLFAGRCLSAGAPPVYGHWGDNMLRLAPGGVEISDDDRNFRGLVDQAPDCALPPISSPR
jgi:hypothetical protein